MAVGQLLKLNSDATTREAHSNGNRNHRLLCTRLDASDNAAAHSIVATVVVTAGVAQPTCSMVNKVAIDDRTWTCLGRGLEKSLARYVATGE